VALTAEAFAETMSALATMPVPEDNSLAPLTSIAAVIAYAFTSVRRDGADLEHALDVAETVVRAANCMPTELRTAAKVLARLGFSELATRLRQIAGRRKIDLKPLA
jgi:hypothetical protein